MDILHQPFVPALAKALGHFLWQGALLGLGAYVVLSVARPRPKLRYAAGVLCLVAMAVSPIATTVYLLDLARHPALLDTIQARAGEPLILTPLSLDSVSVPAPTPWSRSAIVVAVWLAGVLALSLRLFGGWVMARRFARRTRDVVSADVQALARSVAARLALNRLVGIFESSAIGVPMMVGWIKPVVILPTAALAGLTPVQVEALLAHELAHVRRHDYLVNLFQSVIETLLFYHPAVWWVSRQVRDAREECCDDAAIEICDRVVYASALADLAAITDGPRLALAATDGSLLARVRRILGAGEGSWRPKPAWLPALLVVFSVAGLAPIVLMSAPGRPQAQGESAIRPVEITPTAAHLPIASAPQTTSPSSVTAQTASAPTQEPEQGSGSGDQVLTPEQIESLRALKKKLEDMKLDKLTLGGVDNLGPLREQIAAAIEKLRAAIEEKMATARSEWPDEDTLREVKEALGRAEAQVQEKEKSLDRLKVKELTDAAELKERTAAELADLNAEMAAGAGDRAKVMTDELTRKLDKAKKALSEARLSEEPDRERVGDGEREATLLDSAETLSLLEMVANKSAGRILVVGPVGQLSKGGPALPSGVGLAVVRVEWHEGLTAAQAIELAKHVQLTTFLRKSAGDSRGGTDSLRRLAGVNVTWQSGGGVQYNVRTEPIEQGTTLHDGDILFVSSPIR